MDREAEIEEETQDLEERCSSKNEEEIQGQWQAGYRSQRQEPSKQQA